MAGLSWALCLASIALAVASAARGLAIARRAGRAHLARRRLASPTVYLFSAYLVVAAVVTPKSLGETASPLFGLAIVLPVGWALASAASLADERPRLGARLARAVVHGVAVLGAGAIVLALASPAFVPDWLR